MKKRELAATLSHVSYPLKDHLKKDALQGLVPKVKTINKTKKEIDELIVKDLGSVKRSLAVTEQILTYAQVGKETAGNDEVKTRMTEDDIVFEILDNGVGI